MGFLKTLAPIEGGIFWCHREGSAIDPNVQRSSNIIAQASADRRFDEVMLQLQEKLQLPFFCPACGVSMIGASQIIRNNSRFYRGAQKTGSDCRRRRSAQACSKSC